MGALPGQFLSTKITRANYDAQLAEQLKNQPTQNLQKLYGKKEQYPVTATACVLDNDNNQYLIFPLSKTNLNTCKVKCSTKRLWISLQNLWVKAIPLLNGYKGSQKLIVPLIGSGASDVELSKNELLDIIILSLISLPAEHTLKNVCIVLHESVFQDFDLQKTKELWESNPEVFIWLAEHSKHIVWDEKYVQTVNISGEPAVFDVDL